MALIPTKKIPELTAYGLPLAGTEQLEIWAVNTSRRITSRDLVLPAVDPLVMTVDMSSTHPMSRYLSSGPGIQIVDNGPGSSLQVFATGVGALPAAPSALIGMLPVIGAAPTWMRSDSAPAIDSAIAPIWTGLHVYSGIQPETRWNETDAAANNRLWGVRVQGEGFSFGVLTDLGVFAPWVTIDRTNQIIDSIALVSTALTWNGVPIAGGIIGLANPTAVVGLASVNGAALTAMRSDAAPAIDQGISPVWTGLHTVSNTQPETRWNETDAAANNRLWGLRVQGEVYSYGVLTDAGVFASWADVNRTGQVVDSIDFTTPVVSKNTYPLISYPLVSGEAPVDYNYPYNDPRRDGAVFNWDGTTGTNDHAAITARIAALAAVGGTIVIIRSTATASTLVVPNGIILDFQWNQIGALADTPIFNIAPGGQVKNCVVNCEAVVNYASSAVKLVPTSNTQGDRFRPWFTGLYVRLNVYGFGTAIEYDCTEFYMQYMQASLLSVRYGARGVYMHGGDEEVEYCNGNTIHGASLMDVQYPFDLDLRSNGNGFSNIAIENNTGSTIIVAGSSNRWSGVCWDQVSLSISGQGNDFRELRQTTQYGTDITDTGIDNRSGSRGSDYYDKASINTSDDARHELYGPGKIEFRWFPLGGRGPYWTETQVAGTPVTVFGTDIFGATASNRQWMPYMNFTCGVGATLRWDFAGNGFVRAIQNPKIHFTNYTNAGDVRIVWRVGLFFDADNYIVLEQDFGTYADDNIRLITRAAATSTVTSLGDTAAANRVNFCSLLISSTGVTAKVKQYDNASAAAAGRVADGALWSSTVSTIFEVTSTTNIPSTVDLEPYVYVDQGSGGSSAVMYLFDYQLVAGRKARL